MRTHASGGGVYSGGRQRVSLLPDRVRKDNGGGRGHGGGDDEVVKDEVEATRLRVDDGRLITGEQWYADFHQSAVCIIVDYA